MTTNTPSALSISCPLPKTVPINSSVSVKLPKVIGLKIISTVAVSYAGITIVSSEVENGAFSPLKIALLVIESVFINSTLTVVVLSTVVGVIVYGELTLATKTYPVCAVTGNEHIIPIYTKIISSIIINIYCLTTLSLATTVLLICISITYIPNSSSDASHNSV